MARSLRCAPLDSPRLYHDVGDPPLIVRHSTNFSVSSALAEDIFHFFLFRWSYFRATRAPGCVKQVQVVRRELRAPGSDQRVYGRSTPTEDGALSADYWASKTALDAPKERIETRMKKKSYQKLWCSAVLQRQCVTTCR